MQKQQEFSLYFSPLISHVIVHTARSRVYVTVGCPSIRLSVPSIDPSSGGFAACAGRRYRSIAAGAERRSTALSSKCGQYHVDSRVYEAEHRLVA